MKYTHKLKIILSSMVLALGLPLSAYAATLDDVVASIEEFRDDLIEWLGAAKDLYLDHLYEESPTYPVTVVANTNAAVITPMVDNKMTALALPTIKEQLTQQNIDKIVRRLAAAPASDTFQAEAKSTLPFSLTGARKPAVDVSEGDNYLYAGTLLAPLVYEAEKQATEGDEATTSDTPNPVTAKAAFGYLQFASGLGQPLGLNLSALPADQRKKIATTEVGREYTVFLRSMIAARSVALDNLLKMYVRRLSIEGLGTKVGIPDQEDASAAEVDHYLATRRTDDAEWYTAMASAPAVTVARETLFVLAEIQKQLYQLGQDNERILASLSVMQLGQLEAQKPMLQEREGALRNMLEIE